MKKYINIERYKHKYENMFSVGENIVIQEKIDGANASIRVENGEVTCYSRNTLLSPENTLRGFYNFVQSKSEIIKEKLGENLIIYGEWLVPHKVRYPDNKFKNFYVFDIFNLETEEFLTWRDVHYISLNFGFDTAPCFYVGTFADWDSINNFVGRTDMSASPCGEGIVIKSQERLTTKNNKPYCIKIVSETFSEIQAAKNKEPKTAKETEAWQKGIALTKTIVTERRVEKMLDKMIDEGILPVDWDEKSLGIVVKNVPKRIYDDCVKEEPDIVNQIENFGKKCKHITIEYVKKILFSR